ncbi:uncharacterized protein G2W53_035252 [Senna tora]|uniref:Uncharacterized protein n=1 Tax=Senna tora TaxID=362788 RepID=A0A834SR49_9FABA|nr:uncharacterized protein G2W53_035252 [Senna tora]
MFACRLRNREWGPSRERRTRVWSKGLTIQALPRYPQGSSCGSRHLFLRFQIQILFCGVGCILSLWSLESWLI